MRVRWAERRRSGRAVAWHSVQGSHSSAWVRAARLCARGWQQSGRRRLVPPAAAACPSAPKAYRATCFSPKPSLPGSGQGCGLCGCQQGQSGRRNRPGERRVPAALAPRGRFVACCRLEAPTGHCSGEQGCRVQASEIITRCIPVIPCPSTAVIGYHLLHACLPMAPAFPLTTGGGCCWSGHQHQGRRCAEGRGGPGRWGGPEGNPECPARQSRRRRRRRCRRCCR